MTETNGWYVKLGVQQWGPVNEAEVVSWIRTGKIDASAQVYGPGVTDWAPIGFIEVFEDELPQRQDGDVQPGSQLADPDAGMVAPGAGAAPLPPHIQATPFACEDCGHRQAAQADCPKGHGPLLDLRDSNVRLMLLEGEERKARGIYSKTLILSIPLAVALIVGASYLIPGLWLLFAMLPFGLGWVLGFAALGFALNAVFSRLFTPKRKFADLDEL